MKQDSHTPRAAIALLLAGVSLPFNPAFAQEAMPPAPTVNAPPPTVTAPPPTVTAPPPTITAPSPVVAPPPAVETTPDVAPAETPRATTVRRATRASRDAPAPTRARAPARPAAAVTPAPAAAPAAAPVTAPATPPAAAAPAPVPFPPVAPEAAPAEARATDMTWPLLIGAAAILAVAGLWWALRRRRTEEEYERVYVEEDYVEPAVEPASEPGFVRSAALAGAAVPLAAAAPFAPPAPEVVAAHEQSVPATAEPATAADRVAIGEPDAADVEALAAASEAPADRPWLEFLMRPVRAGTTSDDAVVEFELTVGNTGAVAARDVRISTWMFAAGSAAETEMERMLIEPPAEAQVSETDLAPGDGTRVEAALALPKSQLSDAVLPVVVADARYTLPDGSEGRTSASFEVGLPDEEGLAPFPTDRASGLLETVGARLHGELERA